jgi:hypothetical protein
MLSPEADYTLAQVVQRIVEREAIREPNNAIMNALIQLRQKALSKSISVWARAGREIDPLEPVPADIWGTSQVDFIAYLEDERGKLEATKGTTQAKYIRPPLQPRADCHILGKAVISEAVSTSRPGAVALDGGCMTTPAERERRPSAPPLAHPPFPGVGCAPHAAPAPLHR